MVCDRCILAVSEVFSKIEIPANIGLGVAEIEKELTPLQLNILEEKLDFLGFKILQQPVQLLVEKIKNLLITKISELDISENFVLSGFLSQNIGRDYSAISKTFSTEEQITIERFFILQKIEKVKELLLYDEWTLSEIAAKLGYKSVQHLSAQFKIFTGVTPTAFKNLQTKNRIPLDRI